MTRRASRLCPFARVTFDERLLMARTLVFFITFVFFVLLTARFVLSRLETVFGFTFLTEGTSSDEITSTILVVVFGATFVFATFNCFLFV
ncbi:MAG: hypothetical protein H6624_07975 [Bdellovibrionaceae bacterium]|nr:hypothetical protein [Bdellovibrionales bacterium]MCB9084269.1 hypothetical protein [Pseudobdellovibrionaceae bacterium]